MEAAFEQIYTEINPSIVLIQVTIPQRASISLPFFGTPQSQPSQQALGSGFVWDKQGHIVTNNHVVAGARDVSVTFYDGATVPATIVGTDVDSDLAVIKIDVPAEQLNPVVLADSTKVRVGQIAIAIGNPFGEQNTMTTGIVSALGRTLPVAEETSSGPSYFIPDVIQTDAPINPGNSGGVLLNSQGQVIGVTSAIESPVQASAGIGFAIPSVIVQKVVPALINSGRFDHPWLGVLGTNLTPDLARAMNLNQNQRGVLIVQVVSGSPADKAGIQGSTTTVSIAGQQAQIGGDIIVAIEGQTVKRFDDLTAYLARYTSVGQTVTLTLLRGGKQQTVQVTLQARPTAAVRGAGAGAYLGVTGITLTPDIARAMNLPADLQGVLIQQIAPDSPADLAGLQASSTPVTIGGKQVMIGGDIIIGFGSQAVTSVEDLNSLLQQSEPGQRVTLTVVRNGRQGRVRVILDQQPTSGLQQT